VVAHSSTPVPPSQIHDHSAFDNREAILASLTRALLQGGMTTPHGPAPPSHPVLLSSCAVEGCLQLIFATTTLDGSDAYHLPAGADLSPFFRQLHSQLPGSCVDGLVTIHLDDTLAVFKGALGSSCHQSCGTRHAVMVVRGCSGPPSASRLGQRRRWRCS
jgi:hypothetical protein